MRSQFDTIIKKELTKELTHVKIDNLNLYLLIHN